MKTRTRTQPVRVQPTPVQKPIVLSQATLDHERSVYDADPTGGQPSRW